MTDERHVWHASPSQADNISAFLAAWLIWCVVVFLWFGSTLNGLSGSIPSLILILIITLLNAGWKYLVLKNTSYVLTSQSLQTTSGVFKIKTNKLSLSSITDFHVSSGLFMRMFRLGNIVINTSDSSQPVVTIKAIRNAGHVHQKMRSLVQDLRDSKRFKESDFRDN